MRFASVYRDFQDVEAFLVELKDLFQRRKVGRVLVLLYAPVTE